MPDTYISQFSGEEIDAALRAAQIISGASTPAELRKKLEIRGDTIPVSATDPTPISEALTTSGGGINPNLLDNWYFGRPVNQREGKIIPAGKSYYTTPDITLSEAGKTDKAYPVIEIKNYSDYGQRATISISGIVYYVWDQDAVWGYTGDRYTMDRWRLTSDGVLTVADEGIRLTSGALFEPFEYELSSFLKGKTVTYSFLFSDNTLVTKSAVIPSTWGNWDSLIEIGDIQLIGLESGKRIWARYSSTATAVAVKLELGGTQTLAHKENGVWVLNEIPDFGEQLRRCQRYCRVYKAGTTLPCLAYPQMDGGWYASAGLPTNGMRTIPTNNLGDGKKIAITDLDGADATHDDMSMLNWGQNENMLCLRISGGSHGSLTSKFPYWIKLKEDLILSADL